MDPTLPVLLMLSGDDRLENLFGRVCMQGPHNSGVDIKTSMERLANAMDLRRILSAHPSWDQGHRRLNYSRLESCNHLKPSAWKGVLRASICNPNIAWTEGCTLAELVLHKHYIPVNFVEVFNDPNVDTLRPLPWRKLPRNQHRP